MNSMPGNSSNSFVTVSELCSGVGPVPTSVDPMSTSGGLFSRSNGIADSQSALVRVSTLPPLFRSTSTVNKVFSSW